MGNARPTFERRQLGLALRRLRDEAGKTQQHAADAVGKVRTRIVQLEDGVATMSQEDLGKLLDCYSVNGDERRTVLELGAHARTRQKKRVHVDHLPDSYQRFADLEASASEIDCFETGIIPGLLQSEGYMHAILAECEGIWWERDAADSKDRLIFRELRQHRVLDSEDRRIMRFIITEDALRANLGEPEIMREQLRHLLGLLRRHRDLTIRVLRNDVAGNPSRGRGFWIFGFGERAASVGYSESAYGPSSYYDDEADTFPMRRAFYRIWELSLSRQESRRLIDGILKE
ncbi:Putative DNA-binding protein [Alloactinosynnema sp. L-07]|uniref:helix-turn-helix domain-containing protein n=1 Tax=Alloactinosynnema sp. L-07 TaxID=1653480 RepID=UPI00065EF487|nr:helix-turn-helix transcriptional regulator [Alloactinosynnema sp. L-07]CRK60676.1 Putative DNA-binding protein [Alloactinosynnema sp. L-07]